MRVYVIVNRWADWDECEMGGGVVAAFRSYWKAVFWTRLGNDLHVGDLDVHSVRLG